MTPAPKRRWFRFSLRTLFVVIAVGASMALNRLGLAPTEVIIVGACAVLTIWRWLDIWDELQRVRFATRATH